MTESAAPLNSGSPESGAATLSPSEALAALEAHKSDPAWGAKLLAGDAHTAAESERLHKLAYSEPGTVHQPTAGKEAAAALLAKLQDDPAWRQRLVDGDPAAQREHEELMKQLHPEGETAEEAIDRSEYRVPDLSTPDDNEEDYQEALQQQEQVRDWLATAQIPVDIGNSILHEAEQTFTFWRGASTDQQQEYSDKQSALLGKLWGEQAPAKMKLAGQLIRELDARSPGVIDMLRATGAGNNAQIIMSLAIAAENLLAKKGTPHG